MNTISNTLRSERVRQNLTLQQISEATKIGTRLLQAMEAGEFDKLPGGVFTRSFIRQYAAALGIDPNYIDSEMRNFDFESEESTRAGGKRVGRVSSTFRNPVLQGTPSGASSLISSAVWVILALLVCGGVYYIMNHKAGTTSAQPEGGSKARSSPSAREKPQATEQRSPPPVAAAPTPFAQESPQQPPTTPAPLQVVLNASEDSWVSISVDGRRVFSGFLHPSEKKEISASDRVKVVTGNAGGLDISLNGKSIESLGPKGQVRTVELTRAGAQVVSRTPPKPGPLL